jgi:hypothetical protein
MKSLVTVTLLAIVIAGCDGSHPARGNASATPEDVYRSFMIANLSGDEASIRLLVLEHQDAAVLWQGAYPPEVASELSGHYRIMDISRVEAEDTDAIDRVVLQSSAVPMPLEVVRIDGQWKVDAEPIIRFRKAAQDSPLE